MFGVNLVKYIVEKKLDSADLFKFNITVSIVQNLKIYYSDKKTHGKIDTWSSLFLVRRWLDQNYSI